MTGEDFRAAVPTELREEILQLVHYHATSGRRRTLFRVRRRFIWPRMYRDVRAFRDRCVICHRGRSSAEQNAEVDQVRDIKAAAGGKPQLGLPKTSLYTINGKVGASGREVPSNPAMDIPRRHREPQGLRRKGPRARGVDESKFAQPTTMRCSPGPV